MNFVALPPSITDIIAEYEEKARNVPQAINDFEAAGSALRMASMVGGTFGNTTIDTGRINASTMQASLLKSAWLKIYSRLKIGLIASAADKRKFEQSINNPAPFTLENIRLTLGDYIQNPRGNILRGLAEVFCSLDQAYKSHEKVKIGVQGLPKRIILSNVGGYGSWGRDKLENVLNALAQYQGKPLVNHDDLSNILEDGTALLNKRGVRLRRFSNGNGHLFFEPDTLRDINLALAEYYGDVLPDCAEEKPTKKTGSTAVSKDLQYYPTPVDVVERVIENIRINTGDRILEPSCGCGRFMDALSVRGANVYGIEFDGSRAAQSRSKGHNVLTANFLETVPTGDYDRVVMNPPFYGKHYAKHVNHALKFLKEGGTLTAILPVSARYDHGLLNGKWDDLPFGSFKESGTNINTTVLTIKRVGI